MKIIYVIDTSKFLLNPKTPHEETDGETSVAKVSPWGSPSHNTKRKSVGWGAG